MLHFWSPFLKTKRRAAEIFSTILVLDTNSLQIFFEINEKRGDPTTEESQNSPLKSRLFKLISHPHSGFLYWHLPNFTMKNGYKKAQKPCDIWDFCCSIYLGCTICERAIKKIFSGECLRGLNLTNLQIFWHK